MLRDLRLAELSADDQATEIPASSLGLGSRALRNTVIVLTAKVAARLIALFTVLYMVRWLGPPRYGSFSVLVNLTAIASVMLDLGFNVLFVREGARDHKAIQRYLRNVMSLRLLMSAAAFVILALYTYSSGLRALLAGREKLKSAGVQLRIVEASDAVTRLLDMTGTRSLLEG